MAFDYNYNGLAWVNDGPPAINAANLETMDSGIENVTKHLNIANALIDTEFDYITNGDFDLPVVQGTRGTDGEISELNNYVCSKCMYQFKSGTKLSINVMTRLVKAIVTEWAPDGTYIGNVGSFADSVNYIFNGNIIAITFKRAAGEPLTPAQFTFTSSLDTPFSTNFNELVSLKNNDFKYIKFDSFLQGYYKADAVFKSSDSFVCSPMLIIDRKVQFKFPKLSDYKTSIYTWDYSQGSYSNFQQTGYIANDYTMELDVGKAMSVLLANEGGGNISADDVDYEYYLLTSLGSIIEEVEELEEGLKDWVPTKVACVGDSLTEGVDIGTHVIAENYPYFLGKMLGCQILNYGVAGADTKEYWHDNLPDFTFDNTIDTVLIMLGTNGGGIPNTLESDVYPYTDYNDYADTYCGCYCKIIRKIIELTGNKAQVILMTPPYTSYSTGQLNRVKQARETIKEIGVYFNIPIIDVFAECGMGAYNASVFRPHDGCHFNAKGYHRLGTYVGSKIKAIHSLWNLDDNYPDETPVS